jgi:hypothetical protein
MSFGAHAQLATWRARVGPDEATCRHLFGVGRETLQRIESGEIEPEPDIAERIETELLLSGDLCFGGGGRAGATLPGPSPTHGDGHTGAGDRAPAPGAFLGDTR